jgi:hypothetical protein
MYILAINGTVEKYSIGQLRKDNPQVSFPKNPTDSLLASYSVYPVTRTDRPEYDSITQNLTEATPESIEGVWVQTWLVTEATPEEVTQRRIEKLNSLKQQRASAYSQESDPLLFKALRNEVTMEDWQAKVTEIKIRYPYPVETNIETVQE